MKAINIIALAAFAAFVIVLAGCSTGTKDTPAAATQTSTSAPTTSSLPIYKNVKGEIECPVTGSVVTSVDSAVGYQDWNGKRYYFCCAGCPEKFKADPEKFAVRHETEPM